MPRYKVCVVGYIWQPMGFECGNEYEYSAENDEDALEQIEYTHQVTGDFWRVEDFALFRRESCPTCGGRIWECVREFSEEGAATFAECMA